MSTTYAETVSGPLPQEDCQRIVDDILDSLGDPNSQNFNPALAAEVQVWNELKTRASNPTANAIIDMVRAGEKPLHRFFPLNVVSYISTMELQRRRQNGGDGHRSTTSQTGMSPSYSRHGSG
jgi:hypothetical protein